MPEVKMENPGSMSVAGLIIKSIVERNISDPSRYKKISNVESIINIQAGKMKVHLVLNKGEITLAPGLHPNPTAGVAGTMDAIMNVGLMRFHKLPAAMLRGEFKLGGDIMALLPLMSVMKM